MASTQYSRHAPITSLKHSIISKIRSCQGQLPRCVRASRDYIWLHEAQYAMKSILKLARAGTECTYASVNVWTREWIPEESWKHLRLARLLEALRARRKTRTRFLATGCCLLAAVFWRFVAPKAVPREPKTEGPRLSKPDQRRPRELQETPRQPQERPRDPREPQWKA